MAKTRTKKWDAADHLKSDEDMIAYLEAALEENHGGREQSTARVV